MNRHIPYGHQLIDDSDIKSVVGVLKSDWLTQGPRVKEFEKKLCEYAGSSYAVAVSSGTAALHVACLAAGIKADDEVITSPLTFVASANCILYCAGKPVFADIKYDTANIDPEEIKRKVNKKTKAVIPVHFAGHPCDLKEIGDIAKKHGLFVIEDAAHALGAKYKGSRVGACKYSDMTILSFHPVKSITTAEGGAVLTNNKSLYEKLTMLRNHGITKQNLGVNSKDRWYYQMQLLGFNYRMTDIQAALGISQLKKLNKFISRRRQIAGIYNSAFKGNPCFDTPVEKKYAYSAYHIYPIRLKGQHRVDLKRQKIFNNLKQKGLGVQVHYIPVYNHPYYKELRYRQGSCPVAEDFYKREISIPLFPSMQSREIKHVIDSIIKVFKKI